MKTKLSVIALMCSFYISNAQVSPEAFIDMLPPIPRSLCSEVDTLGKAQFYSRIYELSELLNNELDRRNDNTESIAEANEQKMVANALKQSGISPEMAQQMMAIQQKKKTAGTKKQGDEADEEMKGQIDQMLQESTNISMDELENLKNMDEAGKKAWATAYSTEKKAEVMADPKKYQDQNAKGMEKLNLMNRQRQLSDSLLAQQSKYLKQFQELDADSAAVRLLRNIGELRKKLDKMTGYGDAKEQNRKAIQRNIRKLQISYCNIQTPKYLEILNRYESFTKSSLSPYSRLEKITNQVMIAHTGVDLNTEPGAMGLNQIKDYLKYLSNVYKYNSIDPDPDRWD